MTHFTDGAEMGRLKLFEGDILLVVEGGGYRKRRESDILTSDGQEADMMGVSDNTGYTHIWPNRTVYYTFAQVLGESRR